MRINSGRQTLPQLGFGGNLGQRPLDPLLLDQHELMDMMLGNICRRDHFNAARRHDNARLRRPLAAPDMVGKGWAGNGGSRCVKWQ